MSVCDFWLLSSTTMHKLQALDSGSIIPFKSQVYKSEKKLEYVSQVAEH